MRRLILAASIAAVAATAGTAAGADTLENLERERALMVTTLLDPAMSPQERNTKTATFTHRLVDLERMVLRDKSLTGRNTPIVRKAFQNYDLTFLVHASTENDLLIVDHWMDQVGLNTHNLMSARLGRR